MHLRSCKIAVNLIIKMAKILINKGKLRTKYLLYEAFELEIILKYKIDCQGGKKWFLKISIILH